jgi:hypothetical protein
MVWGREGAELSFPFPLAPLRRLSLFCLWLFWLVTTLPTDLLKELFPFEILITSYALVHFLYAHVETVFPEERK